jgi:hypothetical protein
MEFTTVPSVRAVAAATKGPYKDLQSFFNEVIDVELFQGQISGSEGISLSNKLAKKVSSTYEIAKQIMRDSGKM